MTQNAQPETSPSSCSPCQKGFNYCFWAKLIVAVPALPLVAILASWHFTNPASQMAAAGAAMFFVVWAAAKIDRLPIFAGMVVKTKS